MIYKFPVAFLSFRSTWIRCWYVRWRFVIQRSTLELLASSMSVGQGQIVEVTVIDYPVVLRASSLAFQLGLINRKAFGSVELRPPFILRGCSLVPADRSQSLSRWIVSLGGSFAGLERGGDIEFYAYSYIPIVKVLVDRWNLDRDGAVRRSPAIKAIERGERSTFAIFSLCRDCLIFSFACRKTGDSNGGGFLPFGLVGITGRMAWAVESLLSLFPGKP